MRGAFVFDGDGGILVLAISIPGIPSLGSGELILLAVVVIIGVIAIMVLSAAIHFIVPIIAAVAVWLATGNLLYAAAAFLVVAIIQLLARR